MAQAGEIQLRAATMADARLLHEWVNAPDSLANKAATAGPIDKATHEAWLRARLADRNCLLEIVELDGRPVGQVRLEPGERGHMVDIYVEPGSRRAGLARAALAGAIGRVPDRPVVALVKPDNTASLALFRALGFREIGAEGGLRVFQLED